MLWFHTCCTYSAAPCMTPPPPAGQPPRPFEGLRSMPCQALVKLYTVHAPLNLPYLLQAQPSAVRRRAFFQLSICHRVSHCLPFYCRHNHPRGLAGLHRIAIRPLYVLLDLPSYLPWGSPFDMPYYMPLLCCRHDHPSQPISDAAGPYSVGEP